MTETPQEKVARLQHEVDQAKIDDLNRQLAAARAAAGLPVAVSDGPAEAPHVFTLDPDHPLGLNLTSAGNRFQTFDPRQLPPELRARLTPELQNLISSLGQAGSARSYVTGTWSGSDAPVGTEPIDGPPLAAGPRPVPWQFRLMLLPWSWWTVFALFMVAIAPIALWGFFPFSLAVAAAVTFVVVVGLRVRRDRLQLTLLKWGEVAHVVTAETVSVGTYYSGVTYSNVRLAQAHGWQVERRWYSGPATSTKITYDIRGRQATLGLHGLPYNNGVILADPRDPERALCISSFAYDLDRDPSGNWVGRLPARVILGSLLMTLILLAWTAGLVTLGVVLALHNGGIFTATH